jgi:hypothetical protein
MARVKTSQEYEFEKHCHGYAIERGGALKRSVEEGYRSTTGVFDYWLSNLIKNLTSKGFEALCYSTPLEYNEKNTPNKKDFEVQDLVREALTQKHKPFVGIDIEISRVVEVRNMHFDATYVQITCPFLGIERHLFVTSRTQEEEP